MTLLNQHHNLTKLGGAAGTLQDTFQGAVRSKLRLVRMLALVATVVGLCAGASPVWAFDVSPHQVGDSLSTAQAQAVLARYEARPRQPWREPSEARIPPGPEGDQIRDGIDLLRNTSRRVGKLAPDETLRMNWNSLNCVNCHQAGPSGLPGSKPFALALVNAVNDYPKFDIKSGKVISLTQRTLGMFGAAPVPMSPDKPEFLAIMAYLRWLALDTVPDAAMVGSGLLPMKAIQRAADPARGKVLFASKCQACHGADAMGQKQANFEQGGGYLFPPLAGPDTYDNAGHMFAVPLLARYIRASMPLGASHDKPQLTPEQALDIAAFINDDATPRGHNPNRMKLYPDAALRPQGFAIPERFADQTPQAYRRAKFGPFKNINEHY
jgi:thiosulfate dehydrogenase